MVLRKPHRTATHLMAVTPKSKTKAAQESEKLPDVITRESRIETHGYLIRLLFQ